jgi:hypothetical protein
MAHYNLVFSATIAPDLPEDRYLYIDLTGVADYIVGAGDCLEYEVYWASPGAKIAVDLECADGTALRNTATTDQEGRSAAPATALPEQQWYTRKIPLDALVGKTVQKYMLACESDTPGAFTAYFRSIRIVNGQTLRRSIWEITDSVPSAVVARTHHANNSYTLTRATNTAPSTPKNVTVTALSPTSVRIAWTDTTDYNDPGWTVPEWWEVQLADNPHFLSPREFTVSPASVTQQDVAGLYPDKRYYARVRGVNIYFGTSGWAALQQGYTKLLVSDRLWDAQRAPVNGKIILVRWDELLTWQSGTIAVVGYQDVLNGSMGLTAAGSGQALAVFTFENASTPMKSGAVYYSIAEA